LNGEISLFLKALETAFVPKLLNNLRREHASAHFVRAAHRVMIKTHEDDYKMQQEYYENAMNSLPDLEETKASLREQMFDFADMVDDIVFRQEVIKKDMAEIARVHKAREDMPLPTMEEMLKELVNENLWVVENDPRQKDIDAFCGKLLAYMKSGKGDMVALEKEAKSLFPSTLVSKDKPIEDLEYVRTFCTYVRGSRKRMDAWSLKDAMWGVTNKYQDKVDHKRQVVMAHLKGKYHDVVLRMVKHLIEEDKMKDFETIVDHYGQIIKRHKGEVYGSLVSAQDLTDAQFNDIVATLQKQNPGKKYFLNREVDSALGAGFLIKCGADRLDYSLASQTKALKAQVNL